MKNSKGDMRSLIVLSYLFTFCTPLFSQPNSYPSDEYKTEVERLIKDIRFGKVSSEEVNKFSQDATEVKDTLKKAYGNLLIGTFLLTEDDAESFQYLQKSEVVAISMKDSFLLANVYIQKGRLHYHKAKYDDSTTSYFNKALLLSLNNEYLKGTIESYKHLSFQAIRKGEFIAALDYQLLAKPYVEALGDDYETGSMTNNIGHIYMRLSLAQEAIKMFEKHYQIAKYNDWKKGMIVSLINQAEAYTNLEKPAPALDVLSSADSLLSSVSDTIPIMTLYRGFYYQILGKASLINKDYNAAFNAYNRSIEVDPTDKTNRVKCIVGMHQALLGIGDTAKAHLVLLDAELFDQKFPDIHSVVKMELYKNLAKSYDMVGNSTSAVRYHKKHNLLNEKIDDHRILSDYLLKEANQRLEKAQLQQNLSNERIKSEEQQKYILVLLVLIVIVAATFFIYEFYKTKKFSAVIESKNKLLKQQNVTLEKNAEILSLTNQRITYLNKDLSKEVAKKISTINTKNQVIDTYSFLNSHKLRSPVAALKGISKLFFEVSEKDQKTLMNFLEAEINRLDDIVKEIQESLETE